MLALLCPKNYFILSLQTIKSLHPQFKSQMQFPSRNKIKIIESKLNKRHRKGEKTPPIINSAKFPRKHVAKRKKNQKNYNKIKSYPPFVAVPTKLKNPFRSFVIHGPLDILTHLTTQGQKRVFGTETWRGKLSPGWGFILTWL